MRHHVWLGWDILLPTFRSLQIHLQRQNIIKDVTGPQATAMSGRTLSIYVQGTELYCEDYENVLIMESTQQD